MLEVGIFNRIERGQDPGAGQTAVVREHDDGRPSLRALCEKRDRRARCRASDEPQGIS